MIFFSWTRRILYCYKFTDVSEEPTASILYPECEDNEVLYSHPSDSLKQPKHKRNKYVTFMKEVKHIINGCMSTILAFPRYTFSSL
jgi:hypothetical protein